MNSTQPEIASSKTAAPFMCLDEPIMAKTFSYLCIISQQILPTVALRASEQLIKQINLA